MICSVGGGWGVGGGGAVGPRDPQAHLAVEAERHRAGPCPQVGDHEERAGHGLEAAVLGNLPVPLVTVHMHADPRGIPCVNGTNGTDVHVKGCASSLNI